MRKVQPPPPRIVWRLNKIKVFKLFRSLLQILANLSQVINSSVKSIFKKFLPFLYSISWISGQFWIVKEFFFFSLWLTVIAQFFYSVGSWREQWILWWWDRDGCLSPMWSPPVAPWNVARVAEEWNWKFYFQFQFRNGLLSSDVGNFLPWNNLSLWIYLFKHKLCEI